MTYGNRLRLTTRGRFLGARFLGNGNLFALIISQDCSAKNPVMFVVLLDFFYNPDIVLGTASFRK